jgi:hypothetical protein
MGDRKKIIPKILIKISHLHTPGTRTPHSILNETKLIRILDQNKLLRLNNKQRVYIY